MSNQDRRPRQTPNDKQDTNPDDHVLNRRSILLGGTTLAAVSTFGASAPNVVTHAQAQPVPSGAKPNILVIWGDDVGVANISAYSNGLMGYETPNIDRNGRE